MKMALKYCRTLSKYYTNKFFKDKIICRKTEFFLHSFSFVPKHEICPCLSFIFNFKTNKIKLFISKHSDVHFVAPFYYNKILKEGGNVIKSSERITEACSKIKSRANDDVILPCFAGSRSIKINSKVYK